MIDNTFIAVMLASSLAGIVTTIGIYVIAQYETWGRKNIVYFMSFAAGVLISVSFMHIIPKSFQMNDGAPVFLFGGFLALYLFNRFLNLYMTAPKKPQISQISQIFTPASLHLCASALAFFGRVIYLR